MSRWCSDEQERKDTGCWTVNLGKNDQPTQSRPRSMGPARSCAAGQWNRPAGVALVTLGLASGQILLMRPGHRPRFCRRVRQRGARGCARLSTVATQVQSAGKGSGELGEVMALGMSSDEKEPAGL